MKLTTSLFFLLSAVGLVAAMPKVVPRSLVYVFSEFHRAKSRFQYQKSLSMSFSLTEFNRPRDTPPIYVDETGAS